MNRILCATLSAVLGPLGIGWAQLSPANDSGVTMGHLHYFVQDVESNRDFWVRLGGHRVPGFRDTEVVEFPGLRVLLTRATERENTEGSVVNHVAFRVQSLEEVEAAGLEVERLEGFVGIASVFTPEGERIELFDNTATNLSFTPDAGVEVPAIAERHNRPLEGVPIASHHIHLYLAEAAVPEAKQWYARLFGGTPGMRWRYDAVDLPGINFNYSSSPETLAPTRGRMLDHIGFEVRDLERFVSRLEASGVAFDRPYSLQPSGIATATLTDPWGTTIELTEGLDER